MTDDLFYIYSDQCLHNYGMSQRFFTLTKKRISTGTTMIDTKKAQFTKEKTRHYWNPWGTFELV